MKMLSDLGLMFLMIVACFQLSLTAADPAALSYADLKDRQLTDTVHYVANPFMETPLVSNDNGRGVCNISPTSVHFTCVTWTLFIAPVVVT